MKIKTLTIIQIISLIFAQELCAQENYILNSNALANFYLATKNQETPTHIIYIGDSHTAADFITHSLRKKLQEKWGDAGRGIIQFGNPYAGFRPQGLEIQTPNSWENKISYPASKANEAPFGLGGYRVKINNNEKYIFKTIDGDKFNNIAICANTKTKNDNLEIKIYEKTGKIEFGNAIDKINCKTAKLSALIDSFEIGKTSKSPSPEPSSIGVWRDNKGIILSSFGIPGAELKDFDRRSFNAISAEMNIIQPSLVVLAFGTNEGFGKDFDEVKYQELLTIQIERINKIAPSASILIIGAPDANRKTENAGNIDNCKILTPELVNKYPNISNAELGAKYYPPPNLDKVRSSQKLIAEKMNVSFWDWQRAMGGPCSANLLSLLEPREIMGDRVHFSKIGAQKIGTKLAEDIINEFEKIEGK